MLPLTNRLLPRVGDRLKASFSSVEAKELEATVAPGLRGARWPTRPTPRGPLGQRQLARAGPRRARVLRDVCA